MIADELTSDLLLRWEEAHQQGAPLTPEELCRDHVELLDDLRAKISALQSLNGMLAGTGGQGPSTARNGQSHKVTAVDQTFGSPSSRYRAERLHSQGGLGEVHLAHDEELDRPVALKRIRGRYAQSADVRQRFLREAAITGRLQHPGVVPVYGLVHDEDGQPVYCMRFVEGESLHDAIVQFHANQRWTLRQLLARFVSVCNTIAYAHSVGVIHRDLKPANIMLGQFGETLVVDWGLAKAVGNEQLTVGSENEAAELANTAETRAGAIFGTPAYMSPEQAAGESTKVGVASDIYNLGATLYCLLTGQAPFAKVDWTTLEDQIQRGDFRRPRELTVTTPVALEAICLKAMARDPGQRYPSALELAADLEHWLADEPVRACAEPLTTRAARWMRRHRTLTVGTMATLFVGSIGLSVAWYLQTEKTRSEVAFRGVAEMERDAARTQRGRTREALDAMTSTVTEDWLKAQKELLPQQKRFLDGVLRYYESFAAEDATDDEAKRLAIDAQFRVANIYAALGRTTEAESMYRKCLAAYGQLVADHPGVRANRLALATTNMNLGIMCERRGKIKESESYYRTALALESQLAADYPDIMLHADHVAQYHAKLASSLHISGDYQAAEQTYKHAQELYGQRLAADPKNVTYRRALADGHLNLTPIMRDQNRLAEALVENEKGLALYLQLHQENPLVPEIRTQLARAHSDMGFTLQSVNRYADAAVEMRKECQLLLDLVTDQPSVPRYRQRLGASYQNLGGIQVLLGKPDEAIAEFRRALAVQIELAKLYPDMPDHRHAMARSRHNLGDIYLNQKKYVEAEQEYREAIVLREKLLAEHPRILDIRRSLGATYCNLGSLKNTAKDYGAAIGWLTKAIDLLKPVAPVDSPPSKEKQFLCNALQIRAHVYRSLKSWAEELGDWDAMLTLVAPARRPSIQGDRAIALSGLGRHEEALAALEEFTKEPKPHIKQTVEHAAFCAGWAGALPDTAQVREAYAGSAVRLLRLALANGHKPEPAFAADPRFKSLLDRTDFRALANGEGKAVER